MLGLPMMAALTGCDKDEIIFDSELPQFETRADAVLLEVIMPQETTSDDHIYIVGDFNGGLDAAVGNPMWELEKAQANNVKWGIYLDPDTYLDGKTLADGFYFYNAAQGVERTLRNEDVVRTDNPSPGTRTNLTVVRWAEYFNQPTDPDEIEHDGYVIYVIDNTGYDALAMYAWGDAEAFGGWPGIQVTGTVDVNGTVYKYFDTGADNAGLNLNLIFNNNGGGEQLNDFNATLDRDYYLELSPTGVSEIDPNVTTHDGYAVFVVDKTGWDQLWMYMWGEVNDLNGGWPGMEPSGKQTINGVDYVYFDFGEANTGLAENLIFTNNNGEQLSDFAFTINRDLYLELTNKAVEIDPANYGGGDTPAPEVPHHNVYVEDLTGWNQLGVYAWCADNGPQVFGGWPGMLAADQETTVIRGRTFYIFDVEETESVANLIFHNNEGTQFDGISIVIDRDIYLTVTSTTCTEIPREDLIFDGTIFVEDNTGWSEIYVYAYGDKEFFGGWPGKKADGQFTAGGKSYKYWNFTSEGESVNLIFNNNEGVQFDGPYVTLDHDIFLSITGTGYSEGSAEMKNIITCKSIKK